MTPISTYTDANLGRYFHLEDESIVNDKPQKMVMELNPKSTFTYSSSTFSLSHIGSLTNKPVQIRNLSNEVLKIKNRNKNYNFLINLITNDIENLVILNELSYLIKIFIYKDIELPTWKQTVVSIHIPELGIKEKLSLWNSIVTKIYSIVKSKKNKKLYTELKNISIEFR